jgi:membrane protease YdiL (CAAX protease family)
MTTETVTPRVGAVRRSASRHPVRTFIIIVIGIVVPLEGGMLITGLDVMPGKLAELFILVGAAALLTAWIGGRASVRQLFGGLLRARFHPIWWIIVLVGMPSMTIAVGRVTGTYVEPADLAATILNYVIVFLFVLFTASLWEETAWAGFVQTRLMGRHGLLIGSLLTAIPFALIHLPLAWEQEGWSGTSLSDALINLAFVFGSAPVLRYAIGAALVDTKGSLLAAALLHASFNASAALDVVPGGWQYVPALVALTVLIVVVRLARHRDPVSGRVEGTPLVDRAQ